MSVAVNLREGPFSQIGLEIASLTTAYQLATGVYGWYKARERSKSLVELVSISGGELVSTSSFNVGLYRKVRTHHSMMQGVVVQDQRVQRTELPKASTAIPDHPGTACLRALTAGLSCLYNMDAVVKVLQDLIPFALVQLHQEDTTIEFEAALLAGLKQWVSAIMVEEDSDTFRDYMQKEIMQEQSKLTGIPYREIMDLEYSSDNDMPYVIGILRWILTPRHKRESKRYPTRSLKAWTIALVMGYLGFDIQAQRAVVRGKGRLDVDPHDSPRYGETPYVFLTVDNNTHCDPMPLMHVPHSRDSLRPQITLIRGIPWIAFRHLRGSTEVDTQVLADVWQMAFKHAKVRFRGISICKGNIRIEVAESELETIASYHKDLMSEFSPHLVSLCGPSLRHYGPMSPHSQGWGLAELKEQRRILKTPDELENPGSPCRGNCYVLYAIVCGAIYGLCSNACYENGNILGEDSEIAFIPDVLYDGAGARLKWWARTVGNSLMMGYQTPLSQWNDLLFEMFLGKETLSSASLSTARKSYTNQQNPYRERLLLGAQSNGLAAVSNMLVESTAQLESLCYIHIQRGQILSYPLTEDQYIEASSYFEPPSILQLDPEPENKLLWHFDKEYAQSAMRVDVEPCWEEDPRMVSFVVRLQGIPIASLCIKAFFDTMTYGLKSCMCSTPSWEVSVPVSERWQLVSLYQLQRRTYKGMSFIRADVSYGDNRILVDASQSVAATIYAACILHVRTLVVASECLLCSYNHAIRNVQDAGVVVLIPYTKASS